MPKVHKGFQQYSKEADLREALRLVRLYPEQRESRTVIVLERLFDAAGSSKARRADLIAEVASSLAEGQDV